MEYNSLIRVEGITKRFPGVTALENVDFDLRPGEVHVLLGENGAGKSTLIKIMSGAYGVDEGKIYVYGKETVITGPLHAIQMGIATCYQEFNLIQYLTVAENIFLGRFPTIKGLAKVIDSQELNRNAQKIIDSIGIELDVRRKICELGVAQQQMVEIAKALSQNAKIYILDEPSAVLSSKELNEFFRVIKKLRDSGIGIVYISHRLEELPVIGDRVTVLRDGKKIKTVYLKDVTVNQLIEMMVGRSFDDAFKRAPCRVGEELLRTEKLTKEKVFHDIDIRVNAGEIVGIAGLVGSKRTEVVRAIFGADKATSGKVYLKTCAVKIKNPRQAVRKGLSLLPEDRKKQGLVLGLTIKDNVILPSLNKLCKFGVVNKQHAAKLTKDYIEKLSIKTPSMAQKVNNLSGGNQQKVVVAKWLASGCRVFLFDEPTRGIDVGAKSEVYELMHEIVANGGGILMVSSELPEVINVCDRVYVMNNGRICAELGREDLTEERILKFALLGNDEISKPAAITQ